MGNLEVRGVIGVTDIGVLRRGTPADKDSPEQESAPQARPRTNRWALNAKLEPPLINDVV
jgi:hypothetical protein